MTQRNSIDYENMDGYFGRLFGVAGEANLSASKV